MLDYPSHYEAYNSLVDQGSQDPRLKISSSCWIHATLLGV